MNDPVSKPSAGQPDALRRKLTKGGLAAPVVLATLASKPVLGAVPWNCTISGQISGNVSGHGENNCDTVGLGQDALAASYSGNKKNILISTVFPDLTTPYFFKQGNILTTTNTNTVASIYDILTMPAPSTFEYAPKALTLLLNAKNIQDTSIYPLTEFQAKKLFVSAADPNHPAFTDTNPNISWPYNPTVMNYIELLWHA